MRRASTFSKACFCNRSTYSAAEHTCAGAKVHQANGLLSDVEMMALHLLAFTFGGPAIEFLLQLFVGSLGLVRHRCFLGGASHPLFYFLTSFLRLDTES